MDSAALTEFAEQVTGPNGVLASAARLVLSELGLDSPVPQETVSDSELIDLVTAELDAGPIIEQDVIRVDHTRSPRELMALGQEEQALDQLRLRVVLDRLADDVLGQRMQLAHWQGDVVEHVQRRIQRALLE